MKDNTQMVKVLSSFGSLRTHAYRSRRKAIKAITIALPRELKLWKIGLLEERPLLQQARKIHERDYSRDQKPLISVVIATYNRGKLLVEQVLPAIFAQTYTNIEVIVVGDCCIDNTVELIKEVKDSRLRFINLPERGQYPSDPSLRRLVAGCTPINRASDEAKGAWLAHVDDDEFWEPNHLETLLTEALKNDYELVYGQSKIEVESGLWKVYGSEPFLKIGHTNVTHSCVLYRQYLRLFRYSCTSWKVRMGSDSHMFMRMARAGVRAGFVNRVTNMAPLRPNTTKSGPNAEDRALL